MAWGMGTTVVQILEKMIKTKISFSKINDITKLTSSFRSLRFFNSLSSISFCETLDFGGSKKKKTWYSSMAEVEKDIDAVPVSEDEQYGFKRQEMYTGSLAGTVGPYGRHVFLCYKSHETWLPRVEVEGLPQRFAKSFKDRKADFAVEVHKTCLDLPFFVCVNNRFFGD